MADLMEAADLWPGEQVAIMCSALSEAPVASANLLMDEHDNIVRRSRHGAEMALTG